jgi:hypothetical protein
VPRIRTIKPQFWLDEKLGSISRDARLLYIGLWNLSDDQGVFEYRPARIKIQLFPYDTDITNQIIESWLNLLEETGDIVKFSQNGDSFGYIPTFLKHQPIKKPSKWIFAALPDSMSTPLVPHQFPTSTPPVPLGNRLVGNRLVGDREKEKKEKVYKKEIKREVADSVLISEAQLGKLIAQFGEEGAKNRIDKLSLYKLSTGKHYKSDYHTILNWDQKHPGITNSPGQGMDPDKFIKGKYGHMVQR